MQRFLVDWDPEWVPSDVDWGAGISWRCWYHPACRPTVHFRNPLGGGKPMPRDDGTPSHYRFGGSFSELSVQEWVDLGDCFQGFLVFGTFMEEG
jgi:hypothetical protein